ncbi:MAG: ATP-binding cassette domain-containing protein [Chloroflexi bacterium]|nr:ATP-binding cassette domain-containing protein [Chloroflexota bacterium]
MSEQQEALLEVRGLKKYFPIQKGFLRRTVGYVKAVDDVNIGVLAGETLGVVGESGSGKTTLGRCILRLYEPTAGEVLLRTNGNTMDVIQLEGKEMHTFRRNAQMIFQDPYASLNPRMNVLETVGEPLLVNGVAKGKELEERVMKVILQVGLRVEHLRRFPHSFSGGQRQRIGIARALVVNPNLIVADEPVSALDVSIQAQILNLLKDLQSQYHLTYIFISHAMSVIRYMADRIAVMYAGKLVEIGPKQAVLSQPLHPYSEALLAAVPKASQRNRRLRMASAGEPPDLANLPSGCVFHPRCKYATDKCKTEVPTLRSMGPGRTVSCHYADTLKLEGI